MQGIPRSNISKFENCDRFLTLSPSKWVNPNNIITNVHQEPKLPTVEHLSH